VGAERGGAPYTSERVHSFVSAYPFDFIIISSHESQGADLWYHESTYFAGKEKREVYTAYFEEVLQNVKAMDAFSVYGHLDFIRRYGGYADNSLEYADYRDVVDAILAALIEKGKGLEINSSGFRYGLGQTHPQVSILKRYRELGGEIITVGSDAHKPECIAEEFAQCREALDAAGFKAVTLFRGMKPVFVDLESR
jgi:histidinol-phosphatase (PHP family)